MTSTDDSNKPTSKFLRFRTLSITMLLALVLSTWAMVGSGQSASATSHNNKSISIALIGDSYTAGNGAGSYNGPWGSYQSSKNWGNRYADWLKANGVKATLTNLAWSGKETDDINLTQVPSIPQNTDLVMFTAGGNNAEFSEVIKRCFAKGFRSSTQCREGIDNAKSKFTNITSGTKTILQNLENKLLPTSEVVLVGYPLLSLDDTDYKIKTCVKWDTHVDECVKWDTFEAAKAVREAGKELNRKQADLVREWNKTSSLKVTFVDTQSSFATHEPHPSTEEKNPKRWINEFFETNGEENNKGIIDSSFTLDQAKWYHPNITGHRKVALDIINQVGVPSAAKEITPTSGDTDIVFVVDTTGSMGSAIGAVKSDVNSIANQIKAMSRSARFSLISFQDYSSHGGSTGDYPAKTHLNFTSDISSFATSVNGLEVSGGGDWEETVYSGAMAGLDQSWRLGVRKIMIIIGDAPAKDPEPITSYTWQQVAQRAYDIDPVEIYAIDVGYGGLSSTEILQLTSQSGGRVIDARYGDIPASIISSVGESLAKPFGWIQGPYVAKIGETLELDGRGSYAVDGEIAKIEWDLDGDSVFETTTPDLLYSHTFTQEFGGTIGIRVTDTNGNVGIGSTRLDITDDGDSVPRNIDNCPDIANQNQADYDNDGIGDDCDTDIGWPAEDMEGTYVAYGKEEVSNEGQPVKDEIPQEVPKESAQPLAKINLPFNTTHSALFANSEFNAPSVLSAEEMKKSDKPKGAQTDQDEKAKPKSSSNMNIWIGGVVLLITLVVSSVIYKRSKLG